MSQCGKGQEIQTNSKVFISGAEGGKCAAEVSQNEDVLEIKG